MLLGTLMLVLIFSTAPVHAQMQQWTDENGVVHFGNPPRQPTNLESIATLPGEHQITEAGLRKAGIITSVQFQQLFPTWPAVYIGPEFHVLTAEEKSEALWVVLREAKAYMPKLYPQFLAGKVIDALIIWEGKELIGSYRVADGYKPTDATKSATTLRRGAKADTKNFQIIDWRWDRGRDGLILINGELKNNGTVGADVELQLIVRDADNKLIASSTFFTAVKNIPPGTTWPIKTTLRTNGPFTKVELKIIDTRIW